MWMKGLGGWLGLALLCVACAQNEPPPPTDTPVRTALPAPTFALRPTPLNDLQSPTLSAFEATRAVITPPPTRTATASPTPPPLTPSISPSPPARAFPTAAFLPILPAPNQIIFSSRRAGSADVWLMGLGGENPRPFLLAPNSDENHPACHPQGLSFGVVYESTRGGDREIYLSDANQPAGRPLTDTIGENFAPAWSPLGDTLAFVSTRNGATEIWLMDNGGGNVRLALSGESTYSPPAWSPDGSTLLVWAADESESRLLAYDVLGGGILILWSIRPPVALSVPALHPDLRRVLYLAPVNEGQGGVWAADILREQGDTLLFQTEGEILTAAWREGDGLLLTVERASLRHIWDGTGQVLTPVGADERDPRSCFVP